MDKNSSLFISTWDTNIKKKKNLTNKILDFSCYSKCNTFSAQEVKQLFIVKVALLLSSNHFCNTSLIELSMVATGSSLRRRRPKKNQQLHEQLMDVY